MMMPALAATAAMAMSAETTATLRFEAVSYTHLCTSCAGIPWPGRSRSARRRSSRLSLIHICILDQVVDELDSSIVRDADLADDLGGVAPVRGEEQLDEQREVHVGDQIGVGTALDDGSELVVHAATEQIGAHN